MTRTEIISIISRLYTGKDNDEEATKLVILLESELPFAENSGDVDIIEALVSAGLASSNSEARRFMADKAVYLNGQPIGDKTTISRADTLDGYAILRRGKNSMALLRIK